MIPMNVINGSWAATWPRWPRRRTSGCASSRRHRKCHAGRTRELW